MHIGGALHRQRAGVARSTSPRSSPSTEDERRPDGRRRERTRRCHEPTRHECRTDVARRRAAADPARPSAFQDAAQARAGRTPSSAATWARPPRRSAASGAAVVDELPDWEALREAGRAIKERTLRHLDDYLIQLEAVGHAGRRAASTGRATPPRPTAIIAAIVAGHGAKEVVKIKSLTTDEIGLNEALAQAGHRGDRDRPGRADHPARRRTVVAHPRARRSTRTAPRSASCSAAGSDIDEPDRRAAGPWPPRPGPTCGRSSSARRSPSAGPTSAWPRPAPICIVESEGNGRMCLTLPRVLISVMGIEKVIPTWQDFEVFLQLLPRSTTASG